MGILIYIVFGGLVGWAAVMMVGANFDLVSNIIVGIVGAVMCGLVANYLLGTGIASFNMVSFAISIGGASGLIYIDNRVKWFG